MIALIAKSDDKKFADIESFIAINIPNDEKAIKQVKIIYDLYHLAIQVDDIKRVANEIPALENWQQSIITYLYLSAEIFSELKEPKKIVANPVPNTSVSNNSNPEAVDKVNTKVFQDYEIITFRDNEEMALAAIKQLEVAERFSPEQLLVIGKKSAKFAVAAITSQHKRMQREQIFELASLHPEVAIFLAQNYDKFNISRAEINGLLFDTHRNKIVFNSILNYMTLLVTNKEFSKELSGNHLTMIYSIPELQDYAFQNPKAFESSDPIVYFNLFYQYLKNSYLHSHLFRSHPVSLHKNIAQAIIGFLSNPIIRQKLVKQDLCDILLVCPYHSFYECFESVISDKVLSNFIDLKIVLELALVFSKKSNLLFSEIDPTSPVSAKFRSILFEKELVNFENLFALNTKLFNAFVQLFKLEKDVEKEILTKLTNNANLCNTLGPVKIDILVSHYDSIITMLRKNYLVILSMQRLFEMKESFEKNIQNRILKSKKH